MFLPMLYKKRSDGGTQEWHIEVEGNAFRVTSGKQDGKKVTAKWTYCQGKNLGKAAQSSPYC